MIKKSIGALLLVLIFFVFVGCNDNPIFTTEEPTTEIPTTEETTSVETTVEPTTEAPTTEAPTTVEPTTEAPTTEEPTTVEPTTVEPTTEAPTTEATTTEEPTTEAPTTEAPTTVEPTTEAPTTEAPTTEEQNLVVELFFSEYGEGSSYNKYLEIFNGTDEAVDLSQYSVQLYSNGSASVSQSMTLSGMLDSFDVFVIAHPNADPIILEQADITNSQVINFNGDDAVALVKNGIIIDVFGVIGVREDFGTDVTLVRKESVIAPTTTWDIGEWDSYPSDTFDYIGFHSDVQPDESVLLQQDVDALPNQIDLIGNYDFGIGSNGSTYSILSVTGVAADYVNYVVGSNYIESTLSTNGEHAGEISVEVNLEGQEPVVKLISVTVKHTNLDTNTNPEYYSSLAEGISGETLLIALRSILNDTYVGVDYGAARTILAESDADPNNPDNVILVYTRNSVSGVWDGGATWNREHVWPQSFLGDDASNNIVNISSDLHNLKPANPSENSSRSNKYFDYFTTSNTYEPHDDVKGDVARILLYMIVMYNYLELIEDSSVSEVYKMGVLSTLLEWHLLDPVDDFELNRNNVIYFYQGNRNPFVDNPEYVELIWGSDTTN